MKKILNIFLVSSLCFFMMMPEANGAQKDMKTKKAAASDQIITIQAFYKAEDYHQNYFQRNPTQSYCRIVIAPKMEKFRKVFRDNLKK